MIDGEDEEYRSFLEPGDRAVADLAPGCDIESSCLAEGKCTWAKEPEEDGSDRA